MSGLATRAREVGSRLNLAPVHGLVFVLLASTLARTFRLRVPDKPIIFDERYYVNAARIILGLHVPHSEPYSGAHVGLDPNLEHPPLGKLLIAGSMKLFGDGPLGWRLPSLLAGLASIVLVYAIVRAARGDGWMAVLASAVFAFDNLVLVHSRIATLDMPFVAFLLAGVWCWFRHRYFLAGVACALAALIKLPAVYGLLSLVLLALGKLVAERVRSRTWSRSALRSGGLLLLGFISVWVLGLWALDLAFTPYNTPWAHLRHMLDYGFSISNRGGPANAESTPWQWLANQVQMPYFKVDQNVLVNGHVTETRSITNFEGAMNPVVIGAAPFAVSYVAWRAWRLRDSLSLWVVAWVAANYLSYYPLVLIAGRTAYIFYFLPTLPAIAVATAQALRQTGLPRAVAWGYCAGLAIAFVDYYPFRRIF